MDTYEETPAPIKKVFKSSVSGKTATTEVIGNLQCARTGAVSQQSIVNPDLYYICGGIKAADIHSLGCSMCEVFDVSRGAGAPIERKFLDSSCRGFVVGTRIVQGSPDSLNLTSFGWVQVQYVCSESTDNTSPFFRDGSQGNAFYLEVPDLMKTIHQIKTTTINSLHSREFNFVQVALKDDHGTLKSFPLNSARVPSNPNTFIGTWGLYSFCFEPGTVEAVLKQKSSSSVVTVDVRGLEVVAFTNTVRVTKQISNTGLACVDGNGVSQDIDGTLTSFGFWNPAKFNNAKTTNFSIEFMASNNSQFSVHNFGRSSLLQADNMTELFGSVRWKNGKLGFIQSPAPEVKWGCTVQGSTVTCDRNIKCDNSSLACKVEYYDDASDDVIRDATDNQMPVQSVQHQLSGYLTPKESLRRMEQSKFLSFPQSFVLQKNVFGASDCDAVRKALPFSNPAMMLVDTPMLERTSRPHFTESSPTVVVRTSEACYDNSTACHTFAKADNPGGVKICRHFVGCSKEEFVNITNKQSDPPTYVCTGFEKCQQSVSAKYTDVGPHAGYRPSCTFVKACAEPGCATFPLAFCAQLTPGATGYLTRSDSTGSIDTMMPLILIWDRSGLGFALPSRLAPLPHSQLLLVRQYGIPSA